MKIITLHTWLWVICCVVTLAPLLPAEAVEVRGVHIPNKIKTGNSQLVLNGTATRSKWGFGVYVVALYLAKPNRNEKAIMDKDPHGKRVHITMLRKVSAKKFESTIRKNIEHNFTAEEKTRFAAHLIKFMNCFGSGAKLTKSVVINIDYLPGQGTQVSVNGRKIDVIPNHDFYHALLRLWIGEPPQASVKKGLLGKTKAAARH